MAKYSSRQWFPKPLPKLTAEELLRELFASLETVYDDQLGGFVTIAVDRDALLACQEFLGIGRDE